MKSGSAVEAVKLLGLGLLSLGAAGFLFVSLRDDLAETPMPDEGEALPNYDYVPDIRALQAKGKLSEALEMARFVLRQEDMPGREEARILEAELSREMELLRTRAKRVASGFIKGSGHSIEELSGGIASDMVLYGDLRDLFKQGYYKVTGEETDSLIVALAGIGLMTEAVDFADWAPALLKAFRKIGALSESFADFVITAARKSVRGRKMDFALKQALADVRRLADHLGLARTAAVFKYVEDPADLAALAAVAEKNADAAYFTVRNGGADGIDLLKRLGDADDSVAAMAHAAKKGPDGIQWLRRGGSGRPAVITSRYGARVLKSIRLHRPQQWVREVALKHEGFRQAFWGLTGLTALAGLGALVKSARRFHALHGSTSTAQSP